MHLVNKIKGSHGTTKLFFSLKKGRLCLARNNQICNPYRYRYIHAIHDDSIYNNFLINSHSREFFFPKEQLGKIFLFLKKRKRPRKYIKEILLVDGVYLLSKKKRKNDFFSFIFFK